MNYREINCEIVRAPKIEVTGHVKPRHVDGLHTVVKMLELAPRPK